MKRRSEIKLPVLQVMDLFCGAGGFDLGFLLAAQQAGYEVRFKGVNHDAAAIATWRANHPGGDALHTGVDDIDPRSLYKFGELFALLASPACTHHSRARGGVPMNDQSRNTAWCVTRWAESLQPNIIYVENVPEFMDWGPLGVDGRPLKSMKGKTFKAWIGTLEGLGYKVDYRVINAADYGPATTRSRLFVQAVRGKRQIRWPRRTHASAKELSKLQDGLKDSLFSSTDFEKLEPWTPARRIIDWNIKGRWLDEMPGKAQYGGLPLSPKTLARIHAGLRRYGLKGIVPHFGEREGQSPRAHSVEDPLPTVTGQGAGSLFDAYVVPIDHTGNGRIAVDSLDVPLRTVTTEARHGLVEPFQVTVANGGEDAYRCRPISDPIPTVTAGANRLSVVDPMIVTLRGTTPAHIDASAAPVDEPLRTISTSGTHQGLVESFIVEHRGTKERDIDNSARPLAEPISAIATSGGHHSLVEGEVVPDSFLIEVAHGDGCGRGNAGREKSLDNPLGSIPCSNRFGFIEPHLLGQHSCAALRPVSEPAPTITTDGAIALIEGVVENVPAEAFLTKFYGTGGAVSLNDPLDTVTTKDRFGLVMPEAPSFDGPMTPDTILDWTMPRIIINGRPARIRLRWRMLQPTELAAGMSFPSWYVFPGNKTQTVKQIGNAVCPELIKALFSCHLSQAV